MAELSDRQQATRQRFESLIAAAAPFLDIVLGVGERISRIAEPTDHEYYPIRAGAEQRLPPGPPSAAGGDAATASGEEDRADDEQIEDAVVVDDDGEVVADASDAPEPPSARSEPAQ